MRVLSITALTLSTSSLVTPAYAKTKKAPPVAEVPVESAAARAARLAMSDDYGSRRDNELHSSLENATIDSGSATERAPTATEEHVATGPLSGVLEELVGRQMERNSALFDRCVVEAKRRAPNLSGDVAFEVTIAARKGVAHVPTGTEVGLAACLEASAKSLRVSLPDLTFPWKVSLGQPVAVATK